MPGAVAAKKSKNLEILYACRKDTFQRLAVTLTERDRDAKERGCGIRIYDPWAGYRLTISEGAPHEP